MLVQIQILQQLKKVVSKGAGAGILRDIPLMVRLTKVMASTEMSNEISRPLEERT